MVIMDKSVTRFAPMFTDAGRRAAVAAVTSWAAFPAPVADGVVCYGVAWTIAVSM
jgi:hypothetical protein